MTSKILTAMAGDSSWKKYLSPENLSEDESILIARVADEKKPMAELYHSEVLSKSGQWQVSLIRVPVGGGASAALFVVRNPEKKFGEMIPREAILEACQAYEPEIPGIARELKKLYERFAGSPVHDLAGLVFENPLDLAEDHERRFQEALLAWENFCAERDKKFLADRTGEENLMYNEALDAFLLKMRLWEDMAYEKMSFVDFAKMCAHDALLGMAYGYPIDEGKRSTKVYLQKKRDEFLRSRTK